MVIRLRNRWRFVLRAFGALAVRDQNPFRSATRLVLISCHDVDRAMRDGKGRYSSLLEGIRSVLEELGYETANLTHPYAVFNSAEVKGGTVTINYQATLIRLRVILHAWRGAAARELLRAELEVRLYRRLLQPLAPRAILSIQPPASLCMAAKELGIRVIEAMHGTSLSLSDKVFCEHMGQPADRLPDVILSFDDVSQQTLGTLCSGRGIAVLRSHDPWLQLLRRRQHIDGPKREAVQRGNSILVTLQWGYDGERDNLSNIIPNGVLHPVLEAVFAATTAFNFKFLLRLHPIQVNAAGYHHHRTYIEGLCKRYPHLESQRATSAPLPLLLDEVSGHITMSSSSVGEALEAGVPTLLLCPTLLEGGANYGLFREIEQSGLVRFGRLDKEFICDWIKNCACCAPPQINAYDIEVAHEEQKQFYSWLIEASPIGRLSPPAS